MITPAKEEVRRRDRGCEGLEEVVGESKLKLNFQKVHEIKRFRMRYRTYVFIRCFLKAKLLAGLE